MISRLLFAVLLTGAAASSQAQERKLSFAEPDLTSIATEASSPDWIRIRNDVNIPADNFLDQNRVLLGFSSRENFYKVKETKDRYGMRHLKYQQYFGNVKVEGGEFLVHEKNGRTVSANGKTVRFLGIDPNPSISAEDALNKAIEAFPAETYMWQDAGVEKMLKQVRKDPSATFKPSPELVIADKDYSFKAKNYRLAYKLELAAEKPLFRKTVFVDAKTGEVFHDINTLHTANNTIGTANTKYSGTQQIVTDSVSAGVYTLNETTRGGGVTTLDMQRTTSYGNAVNFTDADNNWNNFNSFQDEAATDAHWAAEMTYDYFMIKHGRDSYDDLGSPLISYVHYDLNFVNAFWNGQWMTYGDGDGTSFTALTSLDVGGHEISHGVTEYSANLLYQNESGALNESFSDIFGAAIEFYATPASGDWDVGEDFSSTGQGLRSMSNPNSMGDPDCYGGLNWYTGTADNGGVHTNSGVQNYWFYLLSAGGSGTNDLGNTFSVQGLGVDTAAAIAYRNLTVYLTQGSNYMDARNGSLQAAEDLYGTCSNPVIQTAKAWYACGVGNMITDYDLQAATLSSPVSSCGLTTQEPVSIKIRYNGCNIALQSTDTIPVFYSLNGGATIADTLIPSASVNGGDSLSFTFSVPADLSTVGMHTLKFWSSMNTDTVNYNDTLTVQVENRLQQNIDVGIVNILSPSSSCGLTSSEQVTAEIGFFGCDFLPAGDSIVVAYRLDNNAVVRDTVVLGSVITAGSTFTYTFTQPADLSANGTHTLDCWTEFDIDTLNANDSINNVPVKNPFQVQNQTVAFENPTAVLDSLLKYSNSQSDCMVSNAAENTGVYGFLMTGGDPLNYSGDIVIPDGANNWLVNEDFGAKVCFCVDATSWSTANMMFDLKQTFSPIYQFYAGQPIPEASSLRVLVNNAQIGGNYNPVTNSSDPFTTYNVNLAAYAGTQFEVCFETRNGFSSSADPMAVGDNAYLDNIRFGQNVGVEENTVGSTITIFPNPAGANTTLRVVSQRGAATIVITDVLGRVLYSSSAQLTQGINNFVLPTESLAPGNYLVSVRTEGGNSITRLVKN